MPQQYCILTKQGSNHIIKVGTKSQICEEWCKIRYTMAPDEKYSVKPVELYIGEEMTKEQIEQVVEDNYSEGI